MKLRLESYSRSSSSLKFGFETYFECFLEGDLFLNSSTKADMSSFENFDESKKEVITSTKMVVLAHAIRSLDLSGSNMLAAAK